MLVQKIKHMQPEAEAESEQRVRGQHSRNINKAWPDPTVEHQQAPADRAEDLTSAEGCHNEFQFSIMHSNDQHNVNTFASRYNGFTDAGNAMVMNPVESAHNVQQHHHHQLSSHFSNSNQYFNNNNTFVYEAANQNYGFPQFVQQQQDMYYQQSLYTQKNGAIQGQQSSTSDITSTRAQELSSLNLKDTDSNLNSAVPETRHPDASSQQVDNRTGLDDRARTTSISSESSSKTSTKKEKKRRRKKPKDSPRRPLSAYNLFFKDERKRILLEIPSKEAMKSEDDKIRDSITWPGKKPPPHGKIGFESLAKTIGARWRKIDKETSKHYKALATKDLHRYAREMKEYDAKQSNKKQLEILYEDGVVPTEINACGSTTPDKSISKPEAKRRKGSMKQQQPKEVDNRAIMDIQPEVFKPSQNDVLGNDDDLFSANLDRAKLGSLLNGISFLNEENGNDEDLFTFSRSESQDSSDHSRSKMRNSPRPL